MQVLICDLVFATRVACAATTGPTATSIAPVAAASSSGITATARIAATVENGAQNIENAAASAVAVGIITAAAFGIIPAVAVGIISTAAVGIIPAAPARTAASRPSATPNTH